MLREPSLLDAAPCMHRGSPAGLELAKPGPVPGVSGSGESLECAKKGAASKNAVIERPDITINLEGAGENITVSLDEDPLAPKAHLLVSELMVLTNAALAAWAKEHGVTLLHRTQDVAIPKEFSGIWQTPLEIARVVKALAPAVLETNPRPHAGLGEAMYAPSTSPLRRYPDMINAERGTAIISNAHLDAAGQAPGLAGRPLVACAGARKSSTPCFPCSTRISTPPGRYSASGPATGSCSTSSSRATAAGPPSSLMKTTPSSPPICPRSR